MSAPPQSRPPGTRGRVWNIFVSIGLSFACLACYALLIILYIRPSLYNIPSLVNVGSPSSWSLKPAVAVGLITALLVAATSALVSRSVEHSLWLKIVPRPVQKPLTAGETTRLAMWSVSPLARLTYTISGASWLLKIGGLLLLAITIVSPVLLAGISQTDHFEVSTATTTRAVESWTPWVDRNNRRNRGGSATDLTFIMAAQASNGGFSPPAAPVCEDDTCSVSATSFAVHATCSGQTQPNTVLAGIPTCGDVPEEDWVTNYCSDIMPSMCVNLTCGAPATFAQFKTGTDTDCESDASCISNPGSWAVIFGAWVGGVETNFADKNIINTVSCLVEFGNITITQAGTTSPQVNRSSFRRSKHPLLDYGLISNVRTFIWTESPMRTPYYFSLHVVGTGWNNLFEMPLGHGLLGDDGSNSADVVARRIEDNFDWATLGAFSRQPNASNIVMTTREATRVYVYNRLVLLILLVPLLATLLGTWGRWTVGSDDDVLGYDPVAIATRGPVDGIAAPAFVGSAEYRKACEKLRLVGYEEPVVDPNTGHGGIHVRLRLLAEDES
ncbi:hypothetical protein F5X68DRAFT_221971 [Plectosphaerella plurivora]|uniref:Uncharacterized protein n=1 Tax=Plectosphaerella plurivora TaxID=936078 RepID=A0A9P8VDW3_9PEZI|nr:hypothetical protein F5X68DRAFT_221971 [Plectosphaerella plurivora]